MKTIRNFIENNSMLRNDSENITRAMYVSIDNDDIFVIEICNKFAFVFEFSFGNLTNCRTEEGTDIIEKYLYLIPKSRCSEFWNSRS